MMTETSIINSSNISGMLQRTLNQVEPRLVDHGKRVAFLVSRMLDVQGNWSFKDKQDICFLSLLHDVGAYKTEEIERMVQFESENIWGHSIYGYLFLYYLSPLQRWADVVLLHHVSAEKMDRFTSKHKELAQILNLSDRVDMFFCEYGLKREKLYAYLDEARGKRFESSVVDLFFEAEKRYSLLESLDRGIEFQDVLENVDMKMEEVDEYLKMMTFAIDFRSCHTVTHTITTTNISYLVAKLMGLDEEQIRHVYYGAMLHDLGKIGIPVEILEFPGRLSNQAMTIMRTHVDITEKILGGAVDTVTARIALRHHEKLNGSGYPRKLEADQLTIEERIVAVADIVSALLGTRSYKEAYSMEKVISIITQQAGQGLIDKAVVDTIVTHFDIILDEVKSLCSPILKIYNGLNSEYERLILQFQ
ncbi:MAG: HD domain-containing protein [Clostridiaceae bacterium]|nr:HD domain-containing protein [Clostridiaceae bacterium]